MAQQRNPLQHLTNLDAERAVTGALLIDPDAVMRVADFLEPTHFHDERQRWIYEAVRTLYDQQSSIDHLTVCNALDQLGRLHEVGGAAYLNELIDVTPTALNVQTYARTVYRLAILRRLVSAAAKIAQTAYQAGGSDLDDVIERARQIVDGVTPIIGDDALLLWLESIESFWLEQLDRNREQAKREEGQGAPRIDFPWKALQRFKGLCLRPGTVVVVAGSSGIGKTTFMECCAEHWARQGLNVVFFHLELAHQVMLDRRMARLSGASIDEIEAGAMTETIQRAVTRMRAYPGAVHYVHCPGWSARRVATKMRQMHAKGLVDVAVVDYLQKLRLDYRGGWNKADALGDAVEALKICAEQLGVGVMLGSQFNRSAMYSMRKTGDYIRGSGEPAEKANIVITLDRPIAETQIMDEDGDVIAHPGQRSPQLLIRIDKNTLGETGDTELQMRGSRYLILDTWRENTRPAA